MWRSWCLDAARVFGKTHSDPTEALAGRTELLAVPVHGRERVNGSEARIGVALIAIFRCARSDRPRALQQSACWRPAVTASARAGLHTPHTSTGVPSNSPLRWKIFSFQGFALRSKISKWAASAPHRSIFPAGGFVSRFPNVFGHHQMCRSVILMDCPRTVRSAQLGDPERSSGQEGGQTLGQSIEH